MPVNLAFVNLYNRLIPKWGSRKLFVCLIAIVISLNCTFGAVSHMHPSLTFLFYMWKEIYVLLMFQLVWSVIHANVKLSRAKYLYGVFFGFGGTGSMLGSAFPGFFAVSYGTSTLLFLTLPVYGLLLLSYWKMSKYCSIELEFVSALINDYTDRIQLRCRRVWAVSLAALICNIPVLS